MIQFRCRKHRDSVQRLWQVAPATEGTHAARPIEGLFKSGLQPGGWVAEARGLCPGLYCQTCIDEGNAEPLPDYDAQDLADAGLTDVPHIGLTAADFELAKVWDGLKDHFNACIVAEEERAPSPAQMDSRFRTDARLHAAVRQAILRKLNGNDLYTHQGAAIDAALNGDDVVIETATASGKSLCYWIPVANSLLQYPDATALYLSPLNALAEDQLDAFDSLGTAPTDHFQPGTYPQYARDIKLGGQSLLVARYEGTIKDDDLRRLIRKSQPRVLITNPDMLHYGILPHHQKVWPRFFSNLRFIVIDELHVYRGMFGANFANILRRVLRLAQHYGMRPQIIACSASIGNPRELFTAVTGRTNPVVIPASSSGAPVRRQKRVILDLAKTTDAMSTVVKDLMLESIGSHRARTISFMRSISEVDQVYRYVSGELGRTIKGISKVTVCEYKREIPIDQKSRVTADLKSGATLGVISTTALQLGIDIGDLSVAVIAKFPGSKAAFFQQAGRVGRSGDSIVFFLADRSPLDQWFAQRPAELLRSTAEVVYLNPDHHKTVLDHLRCAAEELPIDRARDTAYWGPQLPALIDELAARGDVSADGREVLIIRRPGDSARDVPIRSLGFEAIVRDEAGTEVARPDVIRAMRRFHKYARFQIQDQAYEVSRLSINWNEKTAEAVARRLDRLDYSTTSVVRTECSILNTTTTKALGRDELAEGDVRFRIFVDSYYKIPTGGGDPVYQPLGVAAPPHHELDTHGLWFTIKQATFGDTPAADRGPAVKSAIESLRIAAALLCCTDPEDILTHVHASDDLTWYRAFLADNEAGGNGLTEHVFNLPTELIDGAIRILDECPHCSTRPESRGCPQCVTTPWGGAADVCRQGGILILRSLRSHVS